MRVADERRPPFAWLALAALQRVRRDLPDGRQAGARNALLALAEAASRRRDGRHREGETLRTLAAVAGVSERRLREHLRDLEAAGLVRIEEARDSVGRDLPTQYTLLDAGSDDSSDRGAESSDRGDGSGDETSAPTRGRPTAAEEEEQPTPDPSQEGHGSRDRRAISRPGQRRRPIVAANEQEACGAFPLPPTGRRRRDRDRYRAQLAAFAETTYGSVDERLLRALDQAIERGGCRSTSEVTEFLRRWWPQLEVAA